MNDQIKNVLIGVFVIIAFSIIVFVLMFLNPNVGDENAHLKVRFANIDKISLGTRVTFGGKPVGEVVGIKEIEESLDQRHPHNGVVYIYELDLAVDSSVKVYNSDEVAARTSGLLGEKSVAITPLAPPKGQPIHLVNNEVIYANEGGSVEETLKEFKELSDKIELALDNVIDLLDRVKNEKIVENIGTSVNNIKDITTSLNKKTEWSELITNLHSISKKVNESWDSIDKTIKQIDEAAASFNAIGQAVARGEGTVGKLLMNDDIYLHTVSIMNKAETLMNDVNHYGLLFHTDKKWQRLRARRLNLLQSLRTPQEFRNYFNDEIDQISTSLARVYMVMEQTEMECPAYALFEDKEFTKVFAELIRRIGVMEEEIRMYNTQIVDHDVKRTEFEECCSY